jgi:hypothetical protein
MGQLRLFTLKYDSLKISVDLQAAFEADMLVHLADVLLLQMQFVNNIIISLTTITTATTTIEDYT